MTTDIHFSKKTVHCNFLKRIDCSTRLDSTLNIFTMTGFQPVALAANTATRRISNFILLNLQRIERKYLSLVLLQQLQVNSVTLKESVFVFSFKDSVVKIADFVKLYFCLAQNLKSFHQALMFGETFLFSLLYLPRPKADSGEVDLS